MQKSCINCLYALNETYSETCRKCVTCEEDHFEPKQTDATDIDDGSIKVGDEVICYGTNTPKVVIEVIEITNISKNDSENKQKKYRCFGETGISTEYDRPLKTGRHFPQIAEVLKLLRGEEV